MLRTSLRSMRALGGRPAAAAAGRQWPAAVVARPAVAGAGKRYFADEKKPEADASKPAAIPASETTTAAGAPPIPTAGVTPTPSTSSKPSPPPPKKGGFFRKLRNYVLTITILGALAFGGGVWYSRVNDNFHDFFTEYVPYGEQAVLYLEEMDFRKRFPQIRATRDAGANVKIPAQSGASWRVADSSDTGARHSSAVPKGDAASGSTPAAKPEEKKAVVDVKATEGKSGSGPAKVADPLPASAPEPPKKSASGAAAGGAVAVVKEATAPATTTSEKENAYKPPEVDEPSRWPPASPIDPLKVNDATDPVVQDLVRMLNDIITVINADKANEKYGATIGKAKNELNKVGQKIRRLKAAAEEEAAAKVKGRMESFDKAATDLVDRVEAAMAAQEEQWRQQFEAEMRRLKDSYDERVKVMADRERQLYEERLNNQLLEQAVELSRQFARDVRDRVEQEREGRLGRLRDLSAAVADLEKLTTGWNEVLDTNLRTQQLHVAVDAVRASLEDAQHPRPFVKELVALKEIASDDPVVDAAIASINPSAYQHGVPTSAELIDRFRRVATEVRKASLLPDDAGVASHASSWVLSKVLFRKQGLAAGDDVESVLTRAQTLLEEGDLDGAAREVNGLTGWAKTLSRDWLGEVRKVLEVQQALDVIATEARLQSLKVE